MPPARITLKQNNHERLGDYIPGVSTQRNYVLPYHGL